MAFPRTTSSYHRPATFELFSWPDPAAGEDDAILGHIPETPTTQPARSRTLDSIFNNNSSDQQDHGYSHSTPAANLSPEHDNSAQAVEIPERGASKDALARGNGSLSHFRGLSAMEGTEKQARDIQRLKQELADVNNELQNALIAREKLEEEKQEIIEKWGQAADEMHKMQTERNLNHDDSYFTGEWRTLKYNIKNCTEQCFDKKPKIGLFARVPRKEFRRLSEDYDKYLMNDDSRPLIMQALIWHYLCEEIFGVGKPVSSNRWAGAVGTSFQTLAQTLRPVNHSSSSSNVNEYHRWRVATASLLHEQSNSKERKSNIAKELAQRLSDTMKPWLTGYLTHFKDYLERIINQAIALDTEMQKQTACYYVHTWKLYMVLKSGKRRLIVSRHQEFEASTMELFGEETNSRRHHKPLSLVLSPVLMKAGNANGEQYEVCDPVVKATVVEQGSHATQRSASRASFNGHRETRSADAMPNAVSKRPVSAMSANVQKIDISNVKISYEPKSLGSKPRWRP